MYGFISTSDMSGNQTRSGNDPNILVLILQNENVY